MIGETKCFVTLLLSVGPVLSSDWTHNAFRCPTIAFSVEFLKTVSSLVWSVKRASGIFASARFNTRMPTRISEFALHWLMLRRGNAPTRSNLSDREADRDILELPEQKFHRNPLGELHCIFEPLGSEAIRSWVLWSTKERGDRIEQNLWTLEVRIDAPGMHRLKCYTWWFVTLLRLCCCLKILRYGSHNYGNNINSRAVYAFGGQQLLTNPDVAVDDNGHCV